MEGWRQNQDGKMWRGWGKEACTAHSQGTMLYLLSMAVAMTTTMAAAVTALLPFSPSPPFPLFYSFILLFFLFVPSFIHSFLYLTLIFPSSFLSLFSSCSFIQLPFSLLPPTFLFCRSSAVNEKIKLQRWQLCLTFYSNVCI